MSFYPRLIITVYWAAFIFILVATPIAAGGMMAGGLLDKVVHFALFGVLAYLAIYALRLKINKFGLAIAAGLLLAIFYAGLTEYIQMSIPGRSASGSDFIAGILGAFLGGSIQLCRMKKK
jgi:VanZ family protein